MAQRQIHGQLLGLFPGFGEEQRVVDVHLRRRVFPFLLELLEAFGHDRDGADLLGCLRVRSLPVTTGTILVSGVILSPFTTTARVACLSTHMFRILNDVLDSTLSFSLSRPHLSRFCRSRDLVHALGGHAELAEEGEGVGHVPVLGDLALCTRKMSTTSNSSLLPVGSLPSHSPPECVPLVVL